MGVPVMTCGTPPVFSFIGQVKILHMNESEGYTVIPEAACYN